MTNCYKILNQLIHELKKLDGIVAYSLFQLPEDNEKRNKIFMHMLKRKKTFYFALENLKLSKPSDLHKVENIWLIKKSLPNCLKNY